MSVMRRLAIVAGIVCLMTGPSLAYDVVIDTFTSAVNTTTQQSFFGTPVMVSDTGLADVLGGSRALTIQSTALTPLVEAGVIPSGVLDYMSQGVGVAFVSYDGGGTGFGNQLACAESIEVVYQDADDAAQGVGTGAVGVIVTLVGGATVDAALPITAAAGTLSFPMSLFPGVDLLNLTSIVLTVDGTGSDSADLAIDSIRAVGCEAPPSPSPAMGPLGLGLGSLMLAGLGWLGMRRRTR